MVTAYELSIDLERAEYEAISALKEWRRLARLAPRGMPNRGALIRNLSVMILGLEGECSCDNALCPECGDVRDTSLMEATTHG